MKLFVCVVVIGVFVLSGTCDATICIPHSKFTIDCNTCRCSESGLEYSCTNQICKPAQDQDQYIREFTKEGYVLLRPKESNKYLLDDNDNFEVPKIRHHRFPYINDEIPTSKEENDVNNGLENSMLLSAIHNVNSEENDYIDDIELNNDVEQWDHLEPKTRKRVFL